MTAQEELSPEDMKKIDKMILMLEENDCIGLLDGPWIDKHQEKYHNEFMAWKNGTGDKPEIVFVN